MLDQRKERLKRLFDELQACGNNEKEFNKVYDLLTSEISKEEAYNNTNKNSYLRNLKQTRTKQAEPYVAAKQARPKGNHYSLYKDFITNFRQDILSGMHSDLQPDNDNDSEF